MRSVSCLLLSVIPADAETHSVSNHASRDDLLLLNQLGLVSGTPPMTEATWRKPVAPDSVLPG
jgi:hypothetical protein